MEAFQTAKHNLSCTILVMGVANLLLHANVVFVQASSMPVLGVYGPFTSLTMAPYVQIVMFDLDFRKNFEPDLVAKYGPPIVSIPNLNGSLKVQIQTGNSNSTESVGVEQNLDFFLGRRGFREINGLVGGYHSAISMPTASVGQVLQKPQVSWGSTSPALSNKDNYKYFLRTIPPDSIQGQAIWKWITTNGAPKVAIIYQEDSYGEGLKKAVSDLAVAAGKAYMVISAGLPSTWNATAAQKAVVSAKATGTKFFLLIVTGNIMSSLSRVLELENCFDGSYQILGSEGSIHPPDPNQTTTKYPSTAARGGLPIGYQNFQPVSKGPLWPKFLQFWRQMNLTYLLAEQTQKRFTVDKWIVPYSASIVDVPTQQWFDGLNAEKNICNECPFLFDAMYTFLFAFNTLYNQGYTPSEMKGRRLLDAVYATSFEGISGQVSFNGVGDRLASYNLEVVVPFGGHREYKVIGEFSANLQQLTYWKFLPNWTRVPTSDPNGTYMKYWMNGARDNQTPSQFTDCLPGYQQDLRTLICSACDGGRFSLGGSGRCERCKWGTRSESHYASTSCLACPAGKHAESDGSSECSDCRKGTFSTSNQTKTCSRCPVGEYQQLPGRTFCNTCGKHKTTLVEGSAGASECKCQEGYFRNSPRNMTCSSQISNESVQCETCPVGMRCPPGSDLQHLWNSLANCSGSCALTKYSEQGPPIGCQPFPLLLKAHYSSFDKPVEIYKCRSDSKCPGGPPGTCGDPGLAGLSCFHCTEGWYWTGKECRRCTSYERSGMNLPGLPMLMGPILICVLYRMFGDRVHKWGSWQNGVAALGFLAVNHYQITVLASSSNIRTSSNLQEMFDVWKASDDLLSLFKPACSGYQVFSKSMLLRSLTPVVLGAEFVITYFVRWLLSKFSFVSQMELNRLLNVFFSIIFTFFAGIVSMSLTIFKCHTNPGSSPPTLNVDESIVCFESQWYDTVGIGVAAFFVYCVGFGTLFAIVIIKSPSKFQDPRFQMRWKFLLIKYRPDVWWWSMVLILKGIVNNIGFIFLDTGIAQLYWIMTVVFIYSLLAIYWLPWRHRQTTFFDIFMHLSLIMVCSILTWFAQQSLSPEEAISKNDDLSSVLMIINLTPLILCIPLAGSMVSAQRLRESNPKQLEMNVEKLLRSMKIFTCSDLEQVQDFVKSLSAWDNFYLQQAHAILEAEFEGKETHLRCRHYDSLNSSNVPDGGSHSDPGQVDSNPPAMASILEEKDTAISKLTEDKRELEVKVQQLLAGLPDEQHVLPPRTSSRRYTGFTVIHDKLRNSDSKHSGWGRNPARQPG